MQYLVPREKKKTQLYTYYLKTLLNPCKFICSTLLAPQTQHQEELFSPPLLQGLFNTVTDNQFSLAQGKMEAQQNILPVLSKGLLVQIN